MYTIKDTELINNDTIAVLYECEEGLNKTEVFLNLMTDDDYKRVHSGEVEEVIETYLDHPIVQRLSEPLFED